MNSIITDHRDAGFPAVAIRTYEDTRLMFECTQDIDPDMDIFYISALGELQDSRNKNVEQDKCPYGKAFRFAAQNRCVLFVAGFRHVVNNPANIAHFIENKDAWKAIGTTVVFMGADWQLPLELKHELPIIQHKLPDYAAIDRCIKTVEDATGLKLNDVERQIVRRDASGLTMSEAENNIALAAVKGSNGSICTNTVATEKARQVEAGGILKILDPIPVDQYGGNENLKNYGTTRILKRLGDPLRRVSGIGMVGVPGCGKTLFARVLCSMLNLKGFVLDFSACKSGLQGSSQANLRDALGQVDAFGECVLVIDEIEKAVGGADATSTDGGTGLEMVGILLKWLDTQEHATVVFTCNDFSKLPAELTRSGRIDRWFFVDLPTQVEREQIAKIHFKKFDCSDEKVLKHAAKVAKDYSGAEVEQLAKECARIDDIITSDTVTLAASEIKPASITQAENLHKLREFAKTRFARASEPETIKKTGRKINITSE